MKKKLKDNPALSSTPGDKAPEKLGECSWCKSVKNPSTLPVPSLIEKIRGIKNGTWCAEVEDVRKGKKNKTEIPEICIYGLFSRSREDKNLKSRSGFIAIDYDKKDNPNLDFTDLKAWLSKLPFVLAVFVSTSGKGLKAIVRIPCIAFNVQKELCKEVLSAHEGVIDMSPAAFKHFIVSYDPEMFLREIPLEEIPPIKSLQSMDAETLSLLFHKVIEPLYSRGKDYYDSNVNEIRSEKQIRRKLNAEGIPKECIDRILIFLEDKKSIRSIKKGYSAHEAGYYPKDKLYVESSPTLLHPTKQGCCDDLKKEFYHLFGDPDKSIQIHILFTLLKNARRDLRKQIEANSGRGEFPVTKFPAVCIMGNRSIGKSCFMEKVLVPLLGGRSMSGKKLLAQNARFTGELEGVENIVLDDKCEEFGVLSRQILMDKIKEIAFSSEVSAERKNKDEIKLSGCRWHIFQLFNPDKINTTPVYEPDKVIFLNAEAHTNMFDNFSEEDFVAFNKKLDSQLEAFAYWLDNEYQPPQQVLPGTKEEKRIGVRAYCHPECERLLNEADRSTLLLEEIDHAVSRCRLSYGTPVRAGEIANAISDSSKSIEAFSRCLIVLKNRYPERIEHVYSGGQSRGWIIREPTGAKTSHS